LETTAKRRLPGLHQADALFNGWAGPWVSAEDLDSMHFDAIRSEPEYRKQSLRYMARIAVALEALLKKSGP
jgi:hypothetical protein